MKPKEPQIQPISQDFHKDDINEYVKFGNEISSITRISKENEHESDFFSLKNMNSNLIDFSELRDKTSSYANIDVAKEKDNKHVIQLHGIKIQKNLKDVLISAQDQNDLSKKLEEKRLQLVSDRERIQRNNIIIGASLSCKTISGINLVNFNNSKENNKENLRKIDRKMEIKPDKDIHTSQKFKPEHYQNNFERRNRKFLSAE